MSPENQGHNLRAEWDLASEALAAGDALLAAGHFRSAVGRYYYACFHAARAALLSRGVQPRTHQGVRFEFNRLFVQEGDVPSVVAAVLASLQQEREDADYSPSVNFREADARQSRDVALQFIEAIRSRLFPTE